MFADYLHSMKVKVQVTQPCPALCNPMDYTAHGNPQARILECQETKIVLRRYRMVVLRYLPPVLPGLLACLSSLYLSHRASLSYRRSLIIL